ncbi:ankyrin repeat domain-containing protein [Arcobacter sp. CECT 8985]|uniref:ankyrin repeat domain-containing protein n=1 Tax=Arcobacter sp. CECT 8985 TaxID=1935424 RepID=UPI00100A570D|nr:ankyrin repeat domain-containing protein [Arcobacter sp. CECT 8985]RXJ85262.1 hypothetical protein CRU93_11555 [Arcobacter sp. CECT 8985]
MIRYLFIFFLLIFISGCVAPNFENKKVIVNNNLSMALRTNNFDKVKQLISKNNINQKDNYGYTPLHIAARYNYIELAKYLLNNNLTKIDEKDDFKDTALLDAIKSKYIDMTKILICKGANINIKDKFNLSTKDYIKKIDNEFLLELINSDNKELLCKENEALHTKINALTSKDDEKINQDKKDLTIRKKDLISVDNYTSINNKKPKICGDLIDLNVKKIILSLKDKTYNAKIKGNTWCAKIDDKLDNGSYSLSVMASYDDYQDIKQEDISIYVLDDLYKDLYNQIKVELPVWNATFDENNLEITFKNKKSFFYEDKIKTDFKIILDQFIPKYISVIKKYEDQIVNVIIVSNEKVSKDEGNIASAEKVYQYLKNIKSSIISSNVMWIEKNIFPEELKSSEVQNMNKIIFKIEVTKK